MTSRPWPLPPYSAAAALLFAASVTLYPQAPSLPAAEQRKAVVTRYSAVGKEGYVGSGAFISGNGDILTCYHVIEGAHSIIAVTQNAAGGLANITVQKISPEADLAVLRLTEVTPSQPYLPVVRQKPTHLLDRSLRVYGYLMGLNRQVIQASATSDEEAPATDIHEPGQDVFNPRTHLTVIPLAMTIYHGLSGGPVVSSDGIIGVVSGAMSQGGALAWAIPVSNLNGPGMRTVGTPPDRVSWAPLTLMAAPWKNMRAEVASAEPTMAAVQQFIESVNETRRTLAAFREAVRASNANTADIIEAIGEIPADKQRLRSSQIARDPDLQQLNARIGALFGKGAQLDQQVNQAGEAMVNAARQSENDMLAVAAAADQAVQALPSTDRNQALQGSVAAELAATRKRIEAHPFPQLQTPENVISDGDSVSVAQLRSYLVQTRANLEEALTPTFNARVEAFLAARESIALPVEHLLIMSSR